MAKKKKNTPAPRPAATDAPTTLKDMLSGEVLEKLKASIEARDQGF